MESALRVVALLLGSALGVLALRRAIFVVASLVPGRPLPAVPDERLPTMTLVVPAHNELDALGPLLAALDRLTYPRGRLTIVLVSDASADGTDEVFSAWAARRGHVRTLTTSERVGKAGALNQALAAADTRLFAVVDADMTPHPDYARRLAAAFDDGSVGGAAACIRPVEPDATPISRLAAVECWVNQLVKSAGKDRLGLNPPTLGAAAYRLDALHQIGGFPALPYGEDVALSVALTRAGWTTRYVPEAVVETEVVRTAADYWSQHMRWSRGSYSALRSRRPAPTVVPGAISARTGSARQLIRNAEAWLLCTNYVDRVILLGALLLAAAGALPLWLPGGYLLIPAVEVWSAIWSAGTQRRLRHFAWTVVLFPLDAVASVAAATLQAARRPHLWTSPSRHIPDPAPAVRSDE